MVYKGKSTTRSWATLPPELVRLIVTHFLLDVSAASFLPGIWAQRELWLGRMVFTVVRDAEIIERLMQVAPAWSSALEYHLFWQQAAAVLDPNDHLLPFARQQRLSPYRQYRHVIYQRSCIPCRINNPMPSQGLLAFKKQVYTYSFGYIPCCREHRKERFCGVCLRDASLDDNSIAENEDTEVWPQVDAACRECRAEWLWRIASDGEKRPGSDLTREAEAVGGQSFAADDWEARQAIDAFVEIGEGNIRDVINLCMEKLWLRKNTKIVEMMQLAVATTRLQTRMAANASEAGVTGTGFGEIYESEEDVSEMDDDEDEDPELMSITEDAQGVRDLAINDWSRSRILDGHWYSPADQWYHLQSQPGSSTLVLKQPIEPFPYMPAHHPVHWNLSADVAEQPHPDPNIIHELPPPSISLCSTAFEAYRRQMRALLLPAMINIVRKVVMESAVDSADACVRIARMDVEDVAEGLRQDGVWYNGMDWMGRRRSEKKDDSDDSSSSNSQATSPVLSASTLQTTPSPPPITESKMKIGNVHPVSNSTSSSSHDAAGAMQPPPPPTFPIAISPVLDSPTQIPSIPFIPGSLAEMPAYTIETFKLIWRDACAPLFQCRCKICERAVLRANIEAGNIVPSQNQQRHGEPRAENEAVRSQLIQVRLDPASEEEESLLPLSDLESEHGLVSQTINRKRSSEVADDIDGEPISSEVEELERKERSPSPPKRARTEDAEGGTGTGTGTPETAAGAVRLQKRSSEEIEGGDCGDSENMEQQPTYDSGAVTSAEEDCALAQPKRARMSISPTPPTTIRPDVEVVSGRNKQAKSMTVPELVMANGASEIVQDLSVEEDGLAMMVDAATKTEEV